MKNYFYIWQIKNFLITMECGINLDFGNDTKLVSYPVAKLITGYKNSEQVYTWHMDLVGICRALEDIGFIVKED